MIVQKFGGTSLGRKGGLKRVTDIVKKNSLQSDSNLIIVVSAFSSIKKSEGITAKLLQASQLAVKGKAGVSKIVQEIEDMHVDLINANIKNKIINKKIKEETKEILKKNKNFLKATEIIGELTSRSIDNIISVGERLSAKIFAAVLQDNSIESQSIDLTEIIKTEWREVTPKLFQTIQKNLTLLLKNSKKKKVFVFTGFIGKLPNGILSTLGRGYTDFTACLLAVAAKAKEIQIWKEVDGVFSADPNIVENAKLLSTIHPEETSELSYYGSEVIHPSAVDFAIKGKIPLRIKNTFNVENEGTLVTLSHIQKKEGAIAVTCKRNIIVLNIYSNKMLIAYGFMGRLFNILRKYHIVIDLIATSEVNVSLTIENKELPASLLKDLGGIGKMTLQKNMSIISVVGKGLKKQMGAAGKMFSTLGKAGINIEIISQGSSEINISCVIRSQDADKALIALHKSMIE